MWEMQALTSSSSLNKSRSDQSSPIALIEGGITDMDTSNDEKSDNELSIMDCLNSDKIEKMRNTSNSGALTPIQTDSLKIPQNSTTSSKDSIIKEV